MFAVILQEPQQIDLNGELNSVFAEVGNTEAVSFDVNYVQVDRQNLDESFGNCEFFLALILKLQIKLNFVFFVNWNLKKNLFCV